MPEAENQRPDLIELSIELDIDNPGVLGKLKQLIQATFRPLLNSQQQANATEQAHLYATILFPDECEEEITIDEKLLGFFRIKTTTGIVNFGLNTARLKVNVTNAIIPIKNIKLSKRYIVEEFEVEEMIHDSENREFQGSLKISPISMFSIAFEAILAFVGKKSNTTGRSTKTKFLDCQVTVKGSPDERIWIFKAKIDDPPILQGLVPETELATVEIQNRETYCVEATFGVPELQDIDIIDVDWLRLGQSSNKKEKTAKTRY